VIEGWAAVERLLAEEFGPGWVATKACIEGKLVPSGRRRPADIIAMPDR